MCKWLILLCVLSLPSALAEPAWTWVDEDGQVHYSDRPVPGARQIELSGAQGFSLPSPQRRNAPGDPPPPGTRYQTLSVASPAAGETLWNLGGNLQVVLEIAPALRAGHQIDVLLDGQRANLNSTQLQLTLPNVFRGTHTLQAVIVDTAGRELQRSPAVSFVVQQTSIQNPNSLPGRRNNAARNAN
jgi:hypothetical protein